jgi:glyoxylase-like metal-dependent hydrolase (beta-lactamase superfamily II)
MTEPTTYATELFEVVPGVSGWAIADDRIGGFTSASYSVRGDDGAAVLIDPLPLAEDVLDQLAPVRAIVLTAATHQRSAWRYRQRFGAPVWLPEGSRETEEEPDDRYDENGELPGGLRVVHTPGPELPHYSLYLERPPGVVFSPDLVMRGEDGRVVFVPGEYHDDPAETLRSVEKTLELDFGILCLAHGLPVTDDPKAALRALLGTTA